MQSLIEHLEKSQAEMEVALETLDWQALVDPERRIRVKDIIAHVAVWEQLVTNGLQAHALGQPSPFAPDFNLDAYLLAEVERRRHMPSERIRSDWHATRQRFQTVISTLTPEQMAAPAPTPWGNHEFPAALVDHLITHEAEHRREILNAMGRLNKPGD